MTSQRQWRQRVRAAVGVAFATALAAASLASLPSIATADPAPPEEPSIGEHDGKLLTEAVERGDKTVKVLVATKPGAAAAGVDELTKAGAQVEYREDALGYARVEVPVDKVKKLAGLSSVQSIDVDEAIPLDDPRPQGQENPAPQPPPDASTPRVNAYLPTGDTGAAQFVDSHPTWDGRGVTVGVIDTGVDLDHPSLNVTSTGERKIVDWVTHTDGGFTQGQNNDGDATWILMTGSLPAGYQAPPGGGTFKFGVFNERDARLGGDLSGDRGPDVNRDGNPPGSVGTFGVLWDQTSNNVWVDTNQNKNFADDKAMTDFKVRNDVNLFGTDNPATAVKEAQPFVVQTSAATQSVNIGIVSGAHGSHVAGIAAGNSLFGGAMSGAAPGAKLVSVRVCLFRPNDGCTSHALIEGMIYAARDANVDVINMSIGGLPALNDGSNTRATLYNRLIDEFEVQMFISAGNSGSGANTVGDPSVADKVVSVGSYISKASWQRNYGSDVAGEDQLHSFSARGPREDGGFKPSIIAPGSATSTAPTWQLGQPVAGAMNLPPGYAMFNGTSMASPQSAGAAAVLISAALQRDVQHTPAQLRQAITSSARFIPGYQAYEQGNGLFTVDRAWNLLQANIRVTDIKGTVPVNTALSRFLATPNVGVGIHDREGVRAGDRYSRDYTFTRTSGADGPVTYKVSWVGNDGTFSAPSAITLRKGFAVKLRVQINPRSVGAHSAILNLDSPTTTGIEYQTMNMVVAAEDFTALNGFTVRHGGTIGRNQVTSHFVRVAPNTGSLTVDLQGGGAQGAGQVRFLRFHPFGLPAESLTNSLFCYNPPVSSGGTCTGGTPTSRAVTNPTPGVWEIVIDARRTSDVAFAPYTVTASVFTTTISPNPDTIASVPAGQPVARSYSLTNHLGQFTGRAVGTSLRSEMRATPKIADQEQAEFEVTVPAGTTEFRARIGGVSDPAADLDLLVFDCTNGCVLRGLSADGDSEEEVTIKDRLNPGVWVVLVHGFAVPGGTTTYNYLDVITNPGIGQINLTDVNAARSTGSSWTVPGTVLANAVPPAGRMLVGNVEVRTDADVLVGSGEVVVQNVT